MEQRPSIARLLNMNSIVCVVCNKSIWEDLKSLNEDTICSVCRGNEIYGIAHVKYNKGQFGVVNVTANSCHAESNYEEKVYLIAHIEECWFLETELEHFRRYSMTLLRENKIPCPRCNSIGTWTGKYDDEEEQELCFICKKCNDSSYGNKIGIARVPSETPFRIEVFVREKVTTTSKHNVFLFAPAGQNKWDLQTKNSLEQ